MNHISITSAASTKIAERKSIVRGGIAALALLAVTALTPGCATEIAAGQEPVVNPTPVSLTSVDPEGPSVDDEAIDELLEDMDSATEITNQFWADHWSELFTGDYTPPEVVGLYNGLGDDVPTCDGEPLESENAVYCPQEHFVAWDADLMARGLDIGSSWVYLVIAHEWGHAVLAQLDPSLSLATDELQADCLAGATLFGAEADGTITMGSGVVKELVDGLNSVSDETPWTKVGDHGDSFERIEAFNYGRENGVHSCLGE